MEEIIMKIIVSGGSARSKAIKAIRCAREGDIKGAKKLMDEAQESISIAHEVQTELIQAEARGEKNEVSLLMVHAQDHIMNAITVKELAEEMIEEVIARHNLQNILNIRS